MGTFKDKTSMDGILFTVFTHKPFPADTEQLTLPFPQLDTRRDCG
jgi:hypothetical protein